MARIRSIKPGTYVRPTEDEWPGGDIGSRKITMLYRFYDSIGTLLYVGVTRWPWGRWATHQRKAAWWHEARVVSTRLYQWESDALDAELAAIRTEHPVYNKRSAVAA